MSTLDRSKEPDYRWKYFRNLQRVVLCWHLIKILNPDYQTAPDPIKYNSSKYITLPVLLHWVSQGIVPW